MKTATTPGDVQCIARVDAREPRVTMRRTHEVQVRAPVEQRMHEVGDVGAPDREHPRVFGAEHPLSEQRHAARGYRST